MTDILIGTSAFTAAGWVRAMLEQFVSSLTSPTVGFLLKLFGGLTTAAFGILGVGVKTREDDGRLNRKGWIALIGILVGGILASGTNVYEFITGQEKEQADRQRSERLILSVQRGVYPLRQMTVSFEMSLANDFEGAVAYRHSIRDQISKDRECKTAKARFGCYGVDEHGKVYLYTIDTSSPLFPASSSPVRDMLDNIDIFVTLFKRLRPEEIKPVSGKPTKYLGRFFVDWKRKLPRNAWLIYDYENDSLSFAAEQYPLKDEDVLDAGVYSLVELFPGFVGASLRVTDLRLCGQNKLSIDACNRKIDAAYKGLALKELTLAFPYPKHIYLSNFDFVECRSEESQFLLLNLPTDIEMIDPLGNIENFKPDPLHKQTCRDLEVDTLGRTKAQVLPTLE